MKRPVLYAGVIIDISSLFNIFNCMVVILAKKLSIIYFFEYKNQLTLLSSIIFFAKAKELVKAGEIAFNTCNELSDFSKI